MGHVLLVDVLNQMVEQSEQNLCQLCLRHFGLNFFLQRS